METMTHRGRESEGITKTTMSTVRRRYRAEGLNAALHEKSRPGAARRLTKKQANEVVAMACALPPEGRARWTIRFIAQEAVRWGLVPKVERETVSELLLNHDLKP